MQKSHPLPYPPRLSQTLVFSSSLLWTALVFPQQSPSNRPMVALATKNAIKASKALLSPVTSLTSLTRKILVIQIPKSPACICGNVNAYTCVNTHTTCG